MLSLTELIKELQKFEEEGLGEKLVMFDDHCNIRNVEFIKEKNYIDLY